MKVQHSAISLSVEDVERSASFVERHLGFERVMSTEGFVHLRRQDVGFDLSYLARDFKAFEPKRLAGQPGDGLLVVFVIDTIDDVHKQMQAEGVEIVTAIATEEWGERFFQAADANGVVYQFVQWVAEVDLTY
jgi:uncharacterized glyoxalase superfamily protein PhnB